MKPFITSLLVLCGMAHGLPVSANLIYVESGGVVVGEGELYSERTDSGPNGWRVVPDESAGAGTFLNARDGKFIQILPDDQSPGGINTAPEIRYPMNLQTTGTYQLFLRWDSNVSVNGGGNSDSLFADIVELKDGVGGTIADHYEYVRSNDDSNFDTNPWDGSAGFEANAGGITAVPAVFDIAAPGIYTLRFSQREDGAAVDAWVFQRQNLAAPTGTGPAISSTVPEPGTVSLLLLGLAGLKRVWGRRPSN